MNESKEERKKEEEEKEMVIKLIKASLVIDVHQWRGVGKDGKR